MRDDTKPKVKLYNYSPVWVEVDIRLIPKQLAYILNMDKTMNKVHQRSTQLITNLIWFNWYP